MTSLLIAALAAADVYAKSSAVHFFIHFGLIGLFFVAIVDSSFIPLPIPGVTDIMLIVFSANHENFFVLLAISTLGSALGGLFSHSVGQAGGMAFLQKHVPERVLTHVTSWMERHAILAVSLPAILPPPAPLSPFVLAAGAAHMSRKRFMWAFTTSRCARHAIAIWLGIHYGKTVIHLWRSFSAKWGMTLLVSFWSITIIFTVIAFWRLYKTSKTMNLKPSQPLTNQNSIA